MPELSPYCRGQEARAVFFERIPAEIRNKIYCLAYTTEDILVYTNSPFLRNDPKQLSPFSTRGPSVIESSLVNKQLYREASEMFFQHAPFVVPIQIQTYLPPAHLSHVVMTNPGRFLPLAVQHVNLLRIVRHVVFEIREESFLVQNRSLVDTRPLSEIVEQLGHLKSLTVTWATKTACLLSKDSDLMTSTIKDLPELLKTFEIYQKSNKTVQVMVKGGKICPSHQTKDYPLQYTPASNDNPPSSASSGYNNDLPETVSILKYMDRLRSLGSAEYPITNA